MKKSSTRGRPERSHPRAESRAQRARRTIFLSAVGGAVLVTLLALVGGQVRGSNAYAGAEDTTPAASPGHPVSHQTTQSLAAVEEYWTPERMAAAQPYPVRHAETASRPQTTSAQGESGPPGVVQGALPGGQLIAATGASEVGAQSTEPVGYPHHGFTAAHVSRHSIFGRFELYPRGTVHKMFFSQDHDGNGTLSNFVCSSSTIGRDGVWTAGHCVHNGLNGAGANGGWSTNVQFCPSYDAGVNPSRGCWGSTSLTTWSNWFSSADLDADFGGSNPTNSGTVHNNFIGNVTGWLGFKWNHSREQAWTALGYPQGAPFNGQKIINCHAAFAYTDGAGASLDGNAIPCDMTGGSSGGPWIEDYGWTGQQGGGGGNFLNGHNSWRHTAVAQEMVSPHFDGRACQMYEVINAVDLPC